MYYIYGVSGPSLLIESTDSMISFTRCINIIGSMIISNHNLMESANIVVLFPFSRVVVE